jgi:predicted nucleic acid-binding protein
MTTIRLVYWDACVFIKHMAPKSKPDDKAIIEGIDELMDEAEKGRALIITSSITRAEVLDCNIPSDGQTKYRKFMRREIVQEYDVDPRIADAAHDIRSHYRKLGRDLNVADSIHIATACLREARQMFTLDGTGKKPGLIAMSGNIADRWNLEICAPRALMGRLFPFTPDSEASAQEPKDDVKRESADARREQTLDASKAPDEEK